MPTILDMYFSEKRERRLELESSTPEEKKCRKTYVVTRIAYEKYCSKCKMLFKAGEIESPMLRYRVFCKAEYSALKNDMSDVNGKWAERDNIVSFRDLSVHV